MAMALLSASFTIGGATAAPSRASASMRACPSVASCPSSLFACGPPRSSGRGSGVSPARPRAGLGRVSAAREGLSVAFDAMGEVAPELAAIPPKSQVDVGLLADKPSLSRQNFDPASEAALNAQIAVEFTNSHFYTALSAYYARDSVGLMGFAKKYRGESDEERKHALEIVDYVNMRGGKVSMSALLAPPADLAENEELGDALAGAEFALALERLTNEKLLALHKVAEEAGALYEAGVFVTRVRRAGLGLGVTAIDQELLA